METPTIALVIITLTVIAVMLIRSLKERNVSRTVIAISEEKAKEAFFEKLKNDFPKEYLNIERNSLGGYDITIKVVKQ